MATLTLTRLERELKSQLDVIVLNEKARQSFATAEWRRRNDSMTRPLLTPPDGNAKLEKGSVPSYSLNLAPANSSGRNVCPRSTAGCRATCLVTAGRFAMGNAPENARQRRTAFMIEDFSSFMRVLGREIAAAERKHGKIAVRLNGLSDIRWELIAPGLFAVHHPGVQFYDYTKFLPGERNPPDNYDLTYSASEKWSDGDIRWEALYGHKVAVVADASSPWRHPDARKRFNLTDLTPLVDGDKNDMRWLNPPGSIILLKPKGKARTGKHRGFVR